MAYPVYVNVGVITQATSVHTGALPGSRVNGNLLILYFKSRNTANDPSVGAGWTQLDTFGFGGASQRFGVYYCFVTGAEAAPAITCAGGGQILSVVAQYSGSDPTTPLLAGTKNGGTGTTATCAAFNSSRDQSLVISATWNDLATSHPLPSGFSNEGTGSFQAAFGSLRLCDVQIATTGSSSGAVSTVHAASSVWGSFLVELKSPALATGTSSVSMMGVG